MSEDHFEMSIREHLRKWISPEVLAEVEARIKQREADEAGNPYYFRRYLEVHIQHILDEAARQAAKETGEGID